jgi:hypothetical protein
MGFGPCGSDAPPKDHPQIRQVQTQRGNLQIHSAIGNHQSQAGLILKKYLTRRVAPLRWSCFAHRHSKLCSLGFLLAFPHDSDDNRPARWRVRASGEWARTGSRL